MLYFLLKVWFLNQFTMPLLFYFMIFLLLLFNVKASYCCGLLLGKKTTLLSLNNSSKLKSLCEVSLRTFYTLLKNWVKECNFHDVWVHAKKCLFQCHPSVQTELPGFASSCSFVLGEGLCLLPALQSIGKGTSPLQPSTRWSTLLQRAQHPKDNFSRKVRWAKGLLWWTSSTW